MCVLIEEATQDDRLSRGASPWASQHPSRCPLLQSAAPQLLPRPSVCECSGKACLHHFCRLHLQGRPHVYGDGCAWCCVSAGVAAAVHAGHGGQGNAVCCSPVCNKTLEGVIRCSLLGAQLPPVERAYIFCGKPRVDGCCLIGVASTWSQPAALEPPSAAC